METPPDLRSAYSLIERFAAEEAAQRARFSEASFFCSSSRFAPGLIHRVLARRNSPMSAIHPEGSTAAEVARADGRGAVTFAGSARADQVVLAGVGSVLQPGHRVVAIAVGSPRSLGGVPTEEFSWHRSRIPHWRQSRVNRS